MVTSETEEVLVLPASFAQQRLWLIDQLDPGSAAYHVPAAVRLTGPLDRAALAAAFTHVVARHESLRTVFDVEDGTPVQIVRPPLPVALPCTDLSALPDDQRSAELDRLVVEHANRPFDLRRGPLLRVSLVALAPEQHVLLVAMHHIVTDGWSKAILFRELGEAYGALAAGREPELAPLPLQYADYAIWQRDELAGAELERQLAYWTETLREPRAVLELPTDFPRPPVMNFTAATIDFRLDTALADAVDALSRAAGATPFMALLAAFQALLQRYTGQDDVLVGTPTAGRGRPELEPLIGLFVNTLALRADLAGEPSFRELIARTRETTLGAFANQDVPFEKLVEALQPARDRSRNPLFQVAFALQNAPAPVVNLGGLVASGLSGGRARAKFDLMLVLRRRDDGYAASFEYAAELFRPETIERLSRHLVTLLRAAVADPDRPVAALPLMDPAERALVVERWNATDAPFASDSRLHDLIAAHATARPDAPAATFEGASLTYRELDERANRVARHLQRLGVAPETLVGLCVERSLDLVVGALGVLKAGGAFLPLDPRYPAERLAYMLEDSGVRLVLTQRALEGRVELGGARRVLLDADWPAIGAEPAAPPTCAAGPRSLAYVIYTSGSTGRPKGTLLEHRGLCNLAEAQRRAFDVTPGSRVIQFAALSFDAAVWELAMALGSGATLVLARQETLGDPVRLEALLRDAGITHATLPPVVLQAMGGADLPALQVLVSAGEACTPDLVASWATGRRFFNAYGPTETTVCASMKLCDPRDPTAPTIGRPLPNHQVYVLDRRGEPLPAGIPGELHVGGAGLARGYLNRPELTAEKFVRDPFQPGPDARLYRTGDLARWTAGGELEFLGRIDHQVKLRGFRIELGEIEATLASHPAVQSAAAIVRALRGERRLLGYFVLEDGADATESELRAHLARTLPDYMVPQILVRLDAFPLSPSGKVDRKALPDPDATLRLGGAAYQQPRSPVEHELVRIWESLLPCPRIGVHDDFFELGGHSLLAARMVYEVERSIGRAVPLAALFERATIEHVAEVIRRAESADRQPIIEVQRGGALRPLFFLHGDWSGGGFYMRSMARALDPARPVYALPPHLPDLPDCPKTVAAMARDHLTAIRRVQPRGPYLLGGYCNGGMIAYEMARQLEAAGERVERLIVVDSAALNAPYRSLAPLFRLFGLVAGLRRERRLLARLRQFYRRWRRNAQQPLRARVRSIARVSLPLPRLSGASAAPAETPVADRRAPDPVLAFYGRTVGTYFPGPYHGRVDLVHARRPWHVVDESRYGWEQVVGDLRVHAVTTDHHAIATHHLPPIVAAIVADASDGAATPGSAPPARALASV